MNLDILKEQNKNDDHKHFNKQFFHIWEELIDSYFEDKQLFDKKNYSLIYCDEHKLNTVVYKNTPAVLYLIIDQPLNFKKSFEFNQSKLKVPELYLSLKDIKKDLFNLSIQNFDDQTLIWKDRCSINFSVNISVDEENVEQYQYKLIPCLKITNQNKVDGVMYYNDNMGQIEVSYPKLINNHFLIKNKSTNNLLSQYCVVIKNLFMKEKRVDDFPFEILETLLYNVPNCVYEDFSQDNLVKILNFLNQLNIKECTTIDEQQEMFGDKYKTMSYIFYKHMMSKLKNIYNKK